MDRLERQYLEEAIKLGIDLRVFTRHETGINSKIRNVDAVVIFTNKVSHQVRKQAMNMAKSNDIPGFCTLKECLECLGEIKKGGVSDEKCCREVSAGKCCCCLDGGDGVRRPSADYGRHRHPGKR
ncbi:MAG TPA: DUF2325 domain-containing protein [Geobacteraceae bacterium]|nr:DUF2325 domain-containing protein [Geobacteraceae bacterium]